jgi:uncharacterized membrane protein YkvA (DUF1232 family)
MDKDTSKRADDAEKHVKQMIDDPAAIAGMADKAQDKIRRNSGRLSAVKKDLEVLIRLLRAWATGKYKGISVTNLLIVAGAVFYFLNPIDAIADFLPMIGFSDDIAVILFALARLKGEFQKFEDWEQTVDVKVDVKPEGDA